MVRFTTNFSRLCRAGALAALPLMAGTAAATTPPPNEQVFEPRPRVETRQFEGQTLMVVVDEVREPRAPLRDATARTEAREVAPGETLITMLTEAGVDNAEAHRAVAALRQTWNPRRLRAGQALTMELEDGLDTEGRPTTRLTSLRLWPDRRHKVALVCDETGAFHAVETAQTLTTDRRAAKGVISSSLFASAAAAGVPDRVLVELVRAYSYDVDFQREIREGDRFEVLYDREINESGEEAGIRLLYARLELARAEGEDLRIFHYTTADGIEDYFKANGHSVRKALMRTPIDGARLSSGYGMRRHPILGYSRMHTGIDFAAPRGTPIYAAGDGTITRAGRRGGYGHYIQIRHYDGYATAYAHLSKYGRGIRPGVRVKQGDVIGYVGSTGRSTGPHLHYEVLRHGKHLNPLSVKLPTGFRLEGQELAEFKAMRDHMEAAFRDHPALAQIASRP